MLHTHTPQYFIKPNSLIVFALYIDAVDVLALVHLPDVIIGSVTIFAQVLAVRTPEARVLITRIFEMLLQPTLVSEAAGTPGTAEPSTRVARPGRMLVQLGADQALSEVGARQRGRPTSTTASTSAAGRQDLLDLHHAQPIVIWKQESMRWISDGGRTGGIGGRGRACVGRDAAWNGHVESKRSRWGNRKYYI